MALILDGEEGADVTMAVDGQGKSRCWNSRPPGSSIPSSIHSNSSHNSEPSVVEHISGNTKNSDGDKASRKSQSAEFWKLPDDDPAGSYLGFEDIQLNETLKSLMETKTPMLPSRIRTAVKPRQHFVMSVEPHKVSTHRVGLGDFQTSTHDEVRFGQSRLPRQSANTDSQADVSMDFEAPMVTELLSSSYCRFSEKSPVQSKCGRSLYQSMHDSPVEAVTQNGCGSQNAARRVSAELPNAVQSHAADTSVLAGRPELLESSAPASSILTSPLLTAADTNSLDSLIARYRNLRDCSAGDRTDTSAGPVSASRTESVNNPYARHSAANSVVVLNVSAANVRDMAVETVGGSPRGASQCTVQTTMAVPHIVQQSRDDVAAAAGNLEDDLCGDNFDDIRLSLQNISLDSTLHTSSQPAGLFCDF